MLIDLSVPLNDKTPVWPGDSAPIVKPDAILEKDGYEVHHFIRYP